MSHKNTYSKLAFSTLICFLETFQKNSFIQIKKAFFCKIYRHTCMFFSNFIVDHGTVYSVPPPCQL